MEEPEGSVLQDADLLGGLRAVRVREGVPHTLWHAVRSDEKHCWTR